MGTNCIDDGSDPYMSAIKLQNLLDEPLKLDLAEQCDKDRCGEHRGYGIKHGKFIRGWAPPPVMEPGSTHIIKVAARNAVSVVNPVGWMKYTLNEGKTKMTVSFEGAGWASLQDCAYVSVTFSGESLPDGVGRDCQWMKEAPFDDEAEPHRQFHIIIHQDPWRPNTMEAGERVLHWDRQLGSALLSLFTPLIVQPAVLRRGIYLITDQTRVDGKQALQGWWRAGAVFHALRFSDIIEAKEPDGFKSALERLGNFLAKSRWAPPISELHFWCHGARRGLVLCGGEELKPEFFKPIQKFTTPDSAIWFRCCSTFAGEGGEGCGPCAAEDDDATQFARKVQWHSRCRYVAGHTVVIGHIHTECYLFDDETQAWSKPVEARGTPEETVASLFKLQRCSWLLSEPPSPIRKDVNPLSGS